MFRSTALVLLGLSGSLFAQYNDYPTGEYEFSKNRFVISPVKVFGGLDQAKRDEGPKVNISFIPNFDVLEARYERILGIDGSLGVGPVATYYGSFTADSVKATAWAAGLYARYYMALASEGYAQLSVQWFNQTGAVVHNGSGKDIKGVSLADRSITIAGPQFSPTLGYDHLFGKHLVLEGQMGITIGNYKRTVSGSPVVVPGTFEGATKTYEDGSDWGGFFFGQLAIGLAW